MDSIIKNWFLSNWEQKVVAIIAAFTVWIFVNQSIIETKTIPNVPIKIYQLPNNKTIIGMLPNNFLGERLTLTLSGTKDVIDNLEPGDLEVHIDASASNADEWVVMVTKKDLISLDPSIDVASHITSITHPEFIIKLSDLVTEQIPIIIREPQGTPPDGYIFLDVWPKGLTQTLSGPQEEIQRLKTKGLKLVLDLNQVGEEDLLNAVTSSPTAREDEIAYLIPQKWKQVPIPFHRYSAEEINDPAADSLRIEFLRKRYLPIEKNIPVHVFFPSKNSATLNPNTYQLAETDVIKNDNGIMVFKDPLYLRDISKVFLDLIRDNIIIVIIVVPKEEREELQWSIEVIDPAEMEDAYVAYRIAEIKDETYAHLISTEEREHLMRKRFREYMHKLKLYTAPDVKLALQCTLEDDGSIQVIRKR